MRLFILHIVFFISLKLFGIEPTVQPSNITVSNLQCISANISWTNGDGTWRIVLVREGSAVNANPIDGNSYASSATFGLGQQIGVSNYVCFNNITNNFTLTGLKQNTDYHIAIYEHDGLGPDFLLTNPTTFSFKTHHIDYSGNFTFIDSCQKTNVFKFRHKTVPTFTGAQYRWEFGDGNFLNADSADYTYLIGGEFTVRLRVLNPRGCTATYALPKLARCIPRPNSNPTETAGDTVQCLRGNLFFLRDRSTLANVNNASFKGTWTFPDGEIYTLPLINKTFATSGLKKVRFVAETFMRNIATGCVDSANLYLRVVDNSKNALSVNDSIQCLINNSFQFRNSTPNTTLAKWYFSKTDSVLGTNISRTFATVGKFKVNHYSETTEGCKTFDSLTIEVKANKNAQFTVNKPSFCLNEGPAVFTPINAGGNFIGPDIVGKEMLFKTIGVKRVKYLIPDTFCPDSLEVTFNVENVPTFSLPDTFLCDGIPLDVEVNAGTSVEWEDLSINRKRSLVNEGNYFAIAREGNCKFTDTFILKSYTTPSFNFPNDTLLCNGQVLRLSIANNSKTQYNWSNGVRDSAQTITSAGFYSAIATNQCGTATSSITIRYEKESCDLFIPNAFSPNSNNRNEIFTIVAKNQLTVTSFLIYNRWGSKVYDMRTANNKLGWDGMYMQKPAPDGVYVYQLTYKTGSGNLGVINGNVSLFR